MNIKIFCRSKTGNTLKVAKELASTAEAFLSSAARPAGSVTVDCGSSDGPSIVRFSDSDRGRTDLLFLGAAVYATEDHDILPEVQAFIGTLDASNTAAVALFATGFSTAALASMRRLLAARGVRVLGESFFCKGKLFFVFNAGRPNESDLASARAFGLKTLASVKQ